MPAESTSVSERMAAAFSRLSESAKNINEISNELAKPVTSLQNALQTLNVGVACWTTIEGDEEFGDYWSHDVGYARVKGNWCLAIRDVEGNYNYPEPRSLEMWPFNEAPRYLRVKAVDKLPDLIEAMVAATDATAKRLKDKVAPAEELAASVSAFTSQQKKKKK